MEFRLLGPVEVMRGAEPLALGGPKIRTLLAALLLSPGRVVAADQLVDIIWDDDPPATARGLIQSYVSALRRVIGDTRAEVVLTRAPGYLVQVQSGSLDRLRFDDLVAQGGPPRSVGVIGRRRRLFGLLTRCGEGPRSVGFVAGSLLLGPLGSTSSGSPLSRRVSPPSW